MLRKRRLKAVAERATKEVWLSEAIKVCKSEETADKTGFTEDKAEQEGERAARPQAVSRKVKAQKKYNINVQSVDRQKSKVQSSAVAESISNIKSADTDTRF
jgi:hypothetical protein